MWGISGGSYYCEYNGKAVQYPPPPERKRGENREEKAKRPQDKRPQQPRLLRELLGEPPVAHARTHAHTHARAHSHSQPQPDTQYPAAALVWLSARWLTARRHHLRGFQPECGLQPDLVFKEEAAARPGPGRRHWVVPCSCLCVAFSQVASSQTAPARWLSARVWLAARPGVQGGGSSAPRARSAAPGNTLQLPTCGFQPGGFQPIGTS